MAGPFGASPSAFSTTVHPRWAWLWVATTRPQCGTANAAVPPVGRYFKSDDRYTVVVTPETEALIRKTIKELSAQLDPAMFWQVHRSTLVNVHAIDSVVRDERGNLKLRLRHRSELLPVSEPYAHLFRQM